MLNDLFTLHIGQCTKCLACQAVTSRINVEEALGITFPAAMKGAKELVAGQISEGQFRNGAMDVFRASDGTCGRIQIHKERRLMIEAAPDALTVYLRRHQIEKPENKDGLDGPASKILTPAPWRQFK